jgi:hypothetical protein
MSDSVTSLQRFEAVRDASADFLLRWVAESLMNETLCSEKLWGDLGSTAPEADHVPGPFPKYGGRMDD